MENTLSSPINFNIERILSIADPDSIVWGITLLLLAFFALYSLLLMYHWLRYGKGIINIILIIGVYFGVSFVIITSLLSGVILIT